MAQSYSWPAPTVTIPAGGATSANQVTQIGLETAMSASLTSIDGKLTNNTQKTQIIDSSGNSVVVKPLSTQVVSSDNGLLVNAVIHGISTAGGGAYVDVKVNPSGTLLVDGSGVTQPISAASLPLPTGAATAALQTTGNTSLASIDSKLTSPLAVTGPLTDVQLRASAVPVSASALPLPSGAATSALQTTGNASLASIDTKLTSPLTVTGPLTDTQLRATPVPVSGTVTAAATLRSKVNLARNDYSSVNVTTGAYVQLIASTAAQSTMLEIFDSSGQTLVLAVGGAGSEVDQFYINPGGNGQVQLLIPASSRVSIKAVTGTASSGYINLNLYS